MARPGLLDLCYRSVYLDLLSPDVAMGCNAASPWLAYELASLAQLHARPVGAHQRVTLRDQLSQQSVASWLSGSEARCALALG